ncbi:hypothetical protein W97_00397 [Coniosporium apollinis CBS 100218]|uniref:Kynurenine formamidase n=1 Tax=Coniosporium apollinis (strain CBS 100218) TaxID=1168221 RepID=R7YH07_CONA1|nr:uncharacterized protein W97_00397 [Coniosporium apollinis CBS 100218]EON61185.1 hypothetical protein W97_00397 [Coniosporium apollinis CBS 100218]
MSFPQFRNDVPVGYSVRPTRLQTADICLPRPLTESSPDRTFWVIYIHGGAWRDPAITSTSIQPTLTRLLNSPETLCRIAGFASLNYRLSPYPTHATDPSRPDDAARNARHPDHLDDVLAALQWLDREYDVGSLGRRGGRGHEYILVGHSCGATLAFQALRRMAGHGPNHSPRGGCGSQALPAAVVGVCGIYDIPLLVSTHEHPAYREFVEAAFGEEEREWAEVSPADGVGRLQDGGGGGGMRVVVLGQSSEDELVDGGQRDAMVETLREEGFEEGGADKELVVLDMKGKHDEVWENGEEIVRAIEVALDRLSRRM